MWETLYTSCLLMKAVNNELNAVIKELKLTAGIRHPFIQTQTSLLVKGCTCYRPFLVAYGLWAGRDLYRATAPVTRRLGYIGLFQISHGKMKHLNYCGSIIVLGGLMFVDLVGHPNTLESTSHERST